MRNNVLSQLKIDKNRENFDYFDYGCDYLCLSYSQPVEYLENLLFGVDFDNSNFGNVEFNGYEFTYFKTSISLGYAINFMYVYNGTSVPIMQYVKFNSNTRHITRKNAKIAIYGSYYRLEQIGEFWAGFLHGFIKSFSSEDPKILRYDMRFDYFSLKKSIAIPEIPVICGYLHNQSSTIERREGNKLIDWSVGNGETGRYKIRYYDKKIDTDKKQKRVLYSDFMKYKSVHRLEIEFLRQFTRIYSLSNIVDLESKIMGVLNLTENARNSRSSMFYRYDSSKEINSENYGKFFDRYISATKKLIRAGYNPYKLIEESIVGECGKDVALGMIEDFINSSMTYARN